MGTQYSGNSKTFGREVLRTGEVSKAPKPASCQGKEFTHTHQNNPLFAYLDIRFF